MHALDLCFVKVLSDKRLNRSIVTRAHAPRRSCCDTPIGKSYENCETCTSRIADVLELCDGVLDVTFSPTAVVTIVLDTSKATSKLLIRTIQQLGFAAMKVGGESAKAGQDAETSLAEEGAQEGSQATRMP